MIVVDENVDQVLIDNLSKDYEVISIRESNPGISDREVIKIAKSERALLLTEDKDFGELVFSHNIRDCSVIFLRYDKSEYEKVEKNILNVLEYYDKNQGHYFITITAKKIRINRI